MKKKINKMRIYMGLGGFLVLVLVFLMTVDVSKVLGSTDGTETDKGTEEQTESETKIVYETEYVEKEITEETIQEGLRDMGILVTEEYYFTEVISESSVEKLFGIFPSESGYVASYDGTAYAGIDFEKITVTKDEQTGDFTVTLPEAEWQSIDIDYDSFQLYSEKEGIGNPLSFTDYNDGLADLEETVRERAEERGILEKADERGRELVKNFAESLVGDDAAVIVVTEES